VDVRASRAYLVAGTLAVCCYLVVPGLAGQTWIFEAVSLSAAAALTVGLVRNRPDPRLPWVLFVVAQLAFFVGDFCYYTFDLPFPSAADGFYLAYYPVLAAGLILLIRRRSANRDQHWDWANLLDVVILTFAFGFVAWLYLIDPNTHDQGVGVLSSLVSGAYPVMDVLLLAVLARLLLGGGARSTALYLMASSVLCLVVTDSVYTGIELTGTYSMGSSLDAGWMASYLLWGAAALHPSMRRLSAPAHTPGATLTTRRILMLAGAVLIGPMTIVLDQQWPVAGFDTEVAIAGTGLIFVLALVRMLGLVATLRAVLAKHERAEQREMILRHAASALTASLDREFVRLATLEGATALVRDVPGAVVDVDLSPRPSLQSDQLAAALGAVVVSVATRAAPYGRLVVSGSHELPSELVDALQTLGSQAALALEAVALSEGLSEQRSEARVAALVQNSSDLIMLVDADLVIRYATESVARSLGHPLEDLIGRPAYTLAEPDQQELVREFYAGLAQRPGKSVTAEWRMQRADGGTTDFEATVTNLLANPSVRGIVVTAHDITNRKALEVGLKRQVEELEELDRIRSEFVASVSHELRTPLTNIIGEIELLVDGDRGELSSCQAHGVDAINRNSERLLLLVDDLLMLSRIESGEVRLHLEPTPVKRLVDDVRSQVQPAAEAKAIALTLECGTDAGRMMADREQLDKALANLVSNAVKFTPESGSVSFTARRIGHDMEFVISDNGVGIPVDEQVRLFTRFFRSSASTRLATQGAGLGLVIVKQIVEAHGGNIGVVSAPGQGTTVTVHIPVGEDPETSSHAAA